MPLHGRTRFSISTRSLLIASALAAAMHTVVPAGGMVATVSAQPLATATATFSAPATPALPTSTATVGTPLRTPTPTTSPTPGCGTVPLVGCKTPLLGGKATLAFTNRDPDDKDLLVWKWLKGAETVLDDFGNPVTWTSYDLCIWDAASSLIVSASAPRSGACGAAEPCWKKTRRGFKYSDFNLTPDGLRRIDLRAGEAGRARIILKGKGERLGLPSLPVLHLPLRVQLRNTAGVCWEATHSTPLRNTTEQFRARGD